MGSLISSDLTPRVFTKVSQSELLFHPFPNLPRVLELKLSKCPKNNAIGTFKCSE